MVDKNYLDFFAIGRAMHFAFEAHGDQMYGDAPYAIHLLDVHKLVKSFGLSIEQEIIAFLHDVLEDTDVTFEELASAFSIEIASAVKILTRNEGEYYFDYIERVCKDKWSREVKFCDVLSNYDACIKSFPKHASLKNKYEKALFYLCSRGD